MELPRDVLDRVRSLYGQGLGLQALRAGEAVAPIREWEGTESRIMAGRVARHLGGVGLGHALLRLAWRKAPADPYARYYGLAALLAQHGPVAAFEAERRIGGLGPAPPTLEADGHGFRAELAALFRDFAAAEEHFARADALAPDRPWVLVQRAYTLVFQDRVEEALASNDRALAVRPWYPPAVHGRAYLLELLGRDAEALALLEEAACRVEDNSVPLQLYSLQTELGRDAEALATLDRIEAMSPLAEDGLRAWIDGHRAIGLHVLGRHDEALAHVQGRDDPFAKVLAERLSAGRDGPRVRLQVPFVRQHDKTCAPATLASIGRYWGIPIDHVELAADICYDGTPAHRERGWAEQRGWTVREFTPTWEGLVDLIDRGVPFALTTGSAINAHQQAVIGYDARLRTVIVRNPQGRHFEEMLAESVLEAPRTCGPKAMLLVPPGQGSRTEGVDLADAALYDRLHEVSRSLAAHDRGAAWGAYEAMREAAPSHRLTRDARCTIASYDVDEVSLLGEVEKLLEAYPDDPRLLAVKSQRLENLARRPERLALLERLFRERASDPVFGLFYARELAIDARNADRAIRVLSRYLRRCPQEAGGHHALADILWEQGRRNEAIDHYRFAACLDDHDEGRVLSYFQAARALGRAEEALRFLADRNRRFGRKSGLPARSLFIALDQMDRSEDAMRVLDEALTTLPDDGDLLLFAAGVHARTGHPEKATALLEQARGRSREGFWLAAAARIAANAGDQAKALALWRQVAEREPTSVPAHAALAQVLAETEGRAAVLDHLAGVVARLPQHLGLVRLWVEWHRADGPLTVEAAARTATEAFPEDAWARRERAWALAQLGRFEEALAEAEEAVRLDPSSPGGRSILGGVLSRSGRLDEARAAFREAIRLSAAEDFAIGALVEAADSPEQRREALTFCLEEVLHQADSGEAMLVWRRVAASAMSPTEVLAGLERAIQARPDLWAAWSALILHLASMGRTTPALESAQRAAERFPLIPAAWTDLAAVRGMKKDAPGQQEALERALALNPAWGVPARGLASVLVREGELVRARETLDRACGRAPLDAENHEALARFLWDRGEREEAASRMRRALLLDPRLETAWEAYASWCAEMGRPEAAPQLALEAAERRGGDPATWIVLARTRGRAKDMAGGIEAVRRAIALDPRSIDAHDLHVVFLTEAERYDEAMAACFPPAWGTQPPIEMRGRWAWVRARRGDVAGAIAAMRDLVAECPQYGWGWRVLADWNRETGDAARYLEASSRLAELTPRDPVAWGFLGHAKLMSKDRRGAMQAFTGALEIDPDYHFARRMLFDLSLEAEEWDQAEEALSHLLRAGRDSDAISRQVRLAAKRRGNGDVCALLRDLFRADGADEGALRMAWEAIDGAGRGRDLVDVFEMESERPGLPPVLGALWVHAAVARGLMGACRRSLLRLRVQGEIGIRATMAWLEALGESKREWRLRWFVWRNQEYLRSETGLWASVGYALLQIGRHRHIARWMSDWRERKGLRPWMLMNLVLALRSVGRDQEALEASRRAVEVALPSEDVLRHRIWFAVEAALAGDVEMARTELALTAGLESLEYFRFLRHVTRAAIAAVASDIIQEDEKELTLARGTIPGFATIPALRNTYRRAVRFIADRKGGLSGFFFKMSGLHGS